MLLDCSEATILAMTTFAMSGHLRLHRAASGQKGRPERLVLAAGAGLVSADKCRENGSSPTGEKYLKLGFALRLQVE